MSFTVGLLIGMALGAGVMFCISCLIDLPFYRAARQHWAKSKELMGEQQRLFDEINKIWLEKHGNKTLDGGLNSISGSK